MVCPDTFSLFGEIVKWSGRNPGLQPKPHLYVVMLCELTARGDYSMVKSLYNRMWPDSAETIFPEFQEEADHLLMEAALNAGQVGMATEKLTDIIARWNRISWTSRGGMVAAPIKAFLGFSKSMFSPYVLPQVSPDQPIESIMMSFEEARPLQSSTQLCKVVMWLFGDPVVPIVDDWGSCVGLLHSEHCGEFNAPLSAMMRSAPPCITTSTSIGHVIDLMLEKRYRMGVVVNYCNLYNTAHSSSPRAVGVFTSEQLLKLVAPVPELPGARTWCFQKL